MPGPVHISPPIPSIMKKPRGIVIWSMIPKSGNRFSDKIMLSQKKTGGMQ
jgi:hypothetical protein